MIIIHELKKYSYEKVSIRITVTSRFMWNR